MTVGRRRIVFVTADPPWPPTSGGDLRAAHIVRALAAHADVVVVLFPLRKAADPATLPPGTVVHPLPLPGPLRRLGLRLAGLVSGQHPFLVHLVRAGAPARLAEVLARVQPDVVVLTHPLTGPFLSLAGGAGGSLVFDLDTSHRLIDRRRVATGRGGARVRAVLDLLVAGRMEQGIDGAAAEVWVASEDARADLAADWRTCLRVVPNVVDVARYEALRRPFDSGTCAFVGAFDYGPNLVAAERMVTRILPRLRTRRPGARMLLIGRRPPARLRRLAAAHEVELHADVRDPWSLLAGRGPLVVPLEAGGGTRVKILEAAASAIPIVTSRLGAEGLDFAPGRDLLVAEDDEAFVTAVLDTWDRPADAERRAASALTTVRDRYDLGVLERVIGEALDRLADRRPEARPAAAGAPADVRG